MNDVVLVHNGLHLLWFGVIKNIRGLGGAA